MTDAARSLQRATIPMIIASAAERFGDRTAVVEDGQALTYRQLVDRSRQFGAALVASGVDPGDRVAVWAFNCTEWIVAALGLFRPAPCWSRSTPGSRGPRQRISSGGAGPRPW